MALVEGDVRRLKGLEIAGETVAIDASEHGLEQSHAQALSLPRWIDVWQALTDPTQLPEWAPYGIDGSLGQVGTVKVTWVGAPSPEETKVTRADSPKVLEFDGIRWELEPSGGGTRLTLRHNINRHYIAMGAAGWHICFDVLDHLLAGQPLGRIVGPDAMKFEGWQRLHAEYQKLFGVETPSWQ